MMKHSAELAFELLFKYEKLLREAVELVHWLEYGAHCPVCRADRLLRAHNSDCKLYAWLTKAKETLETGQ